VFFIGKGSCGSQNIPKLVEQFGRELGAELVQGRLLDKLDGLGAHSAGFGDFWLGVTVSGNSDGAQVPKAGEDLGVDQGSPAELFGRAVLFPVLSLRWVDRPVSSDSRF
jgi:hypothetical protein